jgi:hypothetical protein
MARKSKKAPAKRALSKQGAAKAKTAQRRSAKAAKTASKRKKTARKKAAKRESVLKRLENALLAGAAEVDELAVEMGLAGAVEAPEKPKKKKR